MMIRGLAFAKKTTPFFGFYEECVNGTCPFVTLRHLAKRN